MSKRTFLGKIKVFLGIKKKSSVRKPVRQHIVTKSVRKKLVKPVKKKAKKPARKKPVVPKKPKVHVKQVKKLQEPIVKKQVKKLVTMPEPWSRVEKYKKVKKDNYW